VGFTNHSHLGCWGHGSEKVKLRGLDNVWCKIDMQFMPDEEKLPFLTWCPSGLTLWQIWWLLTVCKTGGWMFFPFLGLVWCTYPIVLWMKS